MLLTDLAALVVTDGYGTLGTTLFRGALQEDPDAQVAIGEYTGAGPLTTFDEPGGCLERPRAQLLVRGPRGDRATPRLLIEQIAQKWVDRGGFTSTDGTRYAAIVPIGSGPYVFKRDDNDRWTFARNFEVWKARTSV